LSVAAVIAASGDNDVMLHVALPKQALTTKQQLVNELVIRL
jgi:hypothetical protein